METPEGRSQKSQQKAEGRSQKAEEEKERSAEDKRKRLSFANNRTALARTRTHTHPQKGTISPEAVFAINSTDNHTLYEESPVKASICPVDALQYLARQLYRPKDCNVFTSQFHTSFKPSLGAAWRTV